MKIVFLFILSLSVSANVDSGQKITAKKFNESTLSVGTIQQSLLTESQFQSLQGNCWVTMIGQDVTGTDYHSITGRTSLPNASGKFLRNVGGNATSLGNSQDDAFQGHRHGGKYYPSGSGGGGGDWLTELNYSNSSNKTTNNAVGSPTSDGTNGTPRTANETRPTNISVNFFIKVNHECN